MACPAPGLLAVFFLEVMEMGRNDPVSPPPEDPPPPIFPPTFSVVRLAHELAGIEGRRPAAIPAVWAAKLASPAPASAFTTRASLSSDPARIRLKETAVMKLTLLLG